MATFLIDLSPRDMQRRLGDALAIYVDAMRYPRGTEDHRASMWVEHSRRRGWQAVAAVDVAHGPSGPLPDDAMVSGPMIDMKLAALYVGTYRKGFLRTAALAIFATTLVLTLWVQVIFG